MKNKKIIIIVITALVLFFLGYYFLTKEDNITTLNLIEKQWIEKNKNKIIDMSIVSDIPVLSMNGEGIVLDFLNSLNEQTNLSFNKVSYKISETPNSDYSFKITDSISNNDILIYTDNYALITKGKKYTSVSELNLNIGVLNEEIDAVNNYLINCDATYKTFEDKETLIDDFLSSNTKLDAIVLRKTIDLKTIITNNLTIGYNINDYKKYFVLSLGNEERLNSILTKYYNKWSSDNYINSYNKYLAKNYYNYKEINDSEAVKFRSKRYYYGFIDNAPFDLIKNGDVDGINSKLLMGFSKLTNAEISYKRYSSIEELIKAFNSNQIDIFYGINGDTTYNMDVYNSSAIYSNKLFVLKYFNNQSVIDTIKSLSNVSVIKNSKIAEYLSKKNIKIKEYDSFSSLIKDVDNDSVIVCDINNYNYYANQLEGFVIADVIDFDSYSFVIRDISDNKLFYEMLDFYINFNDSDKYINNAFSELLIINKASLVLRSIAILLGGIVGILLIILAVIKVKPKKKKNNLSKTDKLKYIDALTSLRNRNYLNDKIEIWDNSEIYPQAIMMIDLNNIAYINDNYGHSEGDNVIKEASNILIMNQIENTEIIRTNGNEFLIYLVGYDEKQIITYKRKLNKELKEIKHNFGAAIGYSMINDAIKTIDDAINEATIDMRNNKEEQNK